MWCKSLMRGDKFVSAISRRKFNHLLKIGSGMNSFDLCTCDGSTGFLKLSVKYDFVAVSTMDSLEESELSNWMDKSIV